MENNDRLLNKYALRRSASLQEAVESVCGAPVRILRRDPLAGGDINRAYLLSLSDGRQLFVKENAAEKISFFVREAEGLQAIRDSGVISVPEVYACGKDGSDSFLLMEYITPGKKIADFYEDFGRRLAGMHCADCSAYTVDGKFGFISNNYIGSGYQDNTPEDSWIVFFRNRRLLPQIRRAEKCFNSGELKVLDRLLEKLDDLLIEPDHPALLHGDLWSGNYVTGSDGRAWLIDPAVYAGHPEADIAMTELFGGFPKAFYKGYYEKRGKEPGYEDRRDLYNLYHLLNHLNLFGAAYLGAVLAVLRKYS